MQISRDGVQKQYKQYGLFNLVLLLLTFTLHAGSFEDFKRIEHTAFAHYRDAKDNEFNTYLKAQWQEYSSEQSPSMYEKKKPKSIISTLEKKIKSVGPRVNIKIKKEKALAKEQQVVKIFKRVTKDINFLFFGQSLGFNLDQALKDAKFYPLDKRGISNFFDTLASSDYEETLIEIKRISQNLNLNDWGVYLLVTQLSREIYENRDDQQLFSWFLFNKLGYAVKVGLEGKHTVLMHYSKKLIYSTPNYSFDGKKFYVISNYAKASTGKVSTYKQNYPDARKALDLSLESLPSFEKELHEKRLSFSQHGEKYSLSFVYDKNLIDFMATYPQADYETYFNAPMESETYHKIANALKKYINGKSSSVALNFVLNFVQKAFIYEVDEKQFGREKVMFAEETLYYAKSDCEDRAILFSYLVKELFGISVIGVKYSEHMATALYIPMHGDSVRAGRRKFIIADPTYINASIGQSMPRYKSIQPESFIVVKKRS